jgi:hypothetical protein
MSNTPRNLQPTQLYDVETSERVNLLAQQRKTPLLLYGIFVELMRNFYSDAYNLPINVCAVWTDDETTSAIWIDTEYKWEDRTAEKRPAIYVKLTSIKYSATVGQNAGPMSMGMDLKEADYFFSRVGEGHVQFVHIGATKGQSVALAGSTLDYLDAFATVIRDDFCFEEFEVIEVTPPKLDKSESKDMYHSDVICRFKFQETWTLKLESPKLKKLVFDAGQNLLQGATI